MTKFDAFILALVFLVGGIGLGITVSPGCPHWELSQEVWDMWHRHEVDDVSLGYQNYQGEYFECAVYIRYYNGCELCITKEGARELK